MKEENKLISVIMLMKNAEGFVSDAIESVLDQTYSNIELIVVDDQSDDDSRRLVEEVNDPRIRLLNGDGNGVAIAFNKALGAAKGYYICRCDADDLFPKTRLALQVSWLKLHPEFGAVCGRYESMDEEGNHVSTFLCGSDREEDVTLELLESKTRTSFCTFLVKRSVVIELGGCRSFFVTSSDIDLQLRLATQIKIAFVPEVTYYYRLHDSSITHTQASNRRVFFEKTARLFSQQHLEKGVDDLQRGMPPDIPNFEDSPSKSNEQIKGLLTSEAWRLHRSGQKMKAISKGWDVCLKSPFSLNGWRNLAVLIVKPTLVRKCYYGFKA